MIAAQNAIEIQNLTVEFRQPHFRSDTFKEFVFNAIAGRRGSRYFRALDSFSAVFPSGSSTALLGHNGSGKSTLLKVISGILQPPRATIITRGRIAPMIELGAGFDGELSGRENIELSCTLMGMSKDEIRDRLPKIIEFSELQEFIDSPFKNYSSGMQARLGFSCAAAVEPEILIVDEVLAVGDSSFQRKCLTRIEEMQGKGLTFILVSHDQNTVRHFCRRGILLDHGRMVFDGEIDEAVRIHENRQFQKFISHANPYPIESQTDDVSSIPKVADVNVDFQQAGSRVEFPDLAQPFRVEVSFSGENFDKAMEQISVGIGIETEAGVRLGGFNNLEKQVLISRPDHSAKLLFTVVFECRNGVPFLTEGQYSIIVGVHDANFCRTLFIGRVRVASFKNSLTGTNKDGDVLALDKSVQAVSIKFEQSKSI